MLKAIRTKELVLLACLAITACGTRTSPHVASATEPEPAQTSVDTDLQTEATAGTSSTPEASAASTSQSGRMRLLDLSAVGGVELTVTNVARGPAPYTLLGAEVGQPIEPSSDMQLANGRRIAIGYQTGPVEHPATPCDREERPCTDAIPLELYAFLIEGDGHVAARLLLPDQGAYQSLNGDSTRVVSAWSVGETVWLLVNYSGRPRPPVDDRIFVHLYSLSLSPFQVERSAVVGTGFQDFDDVTESRVRVLSADPVRVEVLYRLSWLEEVADSEYPDETESHRHFAEVQSFTMTARGDQFATEPTGILSRIVPWDYCARGSQCHPGWSRTGSRWPLRRRPTIACSVPMQSYCGGFPGEVPVATHQVEADQGE